MWLRWRAPTGHIKEVIYVVSDIRDIVILSTEAEALWGQVSHAAKLMAQERNFSTDLVEVAEVMGSGYLRIFFETKSGEFVCELIVPAGQWHWKNLNR